MNKSYRSINIFVSHPFEPNNAAYDIEKFRTNIKLLITQAENDVRKEYQDFEIDTTFVFSDAFAGLPQQIETKIRSSHLAIVDITENKPNIFFEYGLLYGLNIPVLIIKSKSSMDDFSLPSDIKDRMIQVYDNFETLIDRCKFELANFFKKLINDDSLYNIYLPKIWFPNDVGTVHVITSTESEKREQFALPESDNYMLLESLGDKDSLLAIITFLNRNYRNINTPMYAADSAVPLEDNLVIIGGPGDEDGDGNDKCKIFMEKMGVKVSYSEDCEQLLYKGIPYSAEKKGNKTVKDYGYFARFPNPFNPKSSVILVNGIHTFGVLGAAKAFSDHPSAQGNIRKVLHKLKLDDIKQASFECFFPVDILQQSVVCPGIDEDNILPLTR
ncbi:MAG: hypothetical protein ACR2KX_09150 [Chitinophagaceae bacterium]